MHTYSVTFSLTVPDGTDEHLLDEQAIADEIASWLESLRATVSDITVVLKKEQHT